MPLAWNKRLPPTRQIHPRSVVAAVVVFVYFHETRVARRKRNTWINLHALFVKWGEKRVVAPDSFFRVTIRVFSGIFSYRFCKPETAKTAFCNLLAKLEVLENSFLTRWLVVDRYVVFKSILYFVFWANNIALLTADACSIFNTRRRELSGKG